MKVFRSMFGLSQPAASPAVPRGHRVYAIGDIHGRDDLLGEMLAKIEADATRRGPARLVLVFLGDLIDRGPSSAQVVERLRTLRMPGVRPVFLAGNHEEVLLRIIDGESALIGDWLRFGGAECLHSYGVDAPRLRKQSPERIVEMIREAMPPQHIEFLRGFDDTFRAGDYLFVHAGIRPGIPLAEQDPQDLRWIREPFLTDPTDHGFVVVHGHTVRERVEESPNRIGLDTGAYRYGTLTALGLEGTDRWLLQTSGQDTEDREQVAARAISSATDAVSSQSG